MCGHVRVTWYMYGGQRTICGSQFSLLPHVGPRNEIQVVSLGSKDPYLLSHLASPADFKMELFGLLSLSYKILCMYVCVHVCDRMCVCV